MPTTQERPRWANHRPAYRRALKRGEEQAVTAPVQPDEVATPVIDRLIYDFWSEATLLKAKNIRLWFAQIQEDVQSEIPTVGGSRWDLMMASHHGQSGSPMLDPSGRVVCVLSKGATTPSAQTWFGTSMASPHVSGVAALLLATKRSWDISGQVEDVDETSNDPLVRGLLVRNFVFHRSRMVHGWIKRQLSITGAEGDQALNVAERRNLDWIDSTEQILQRLESDATTHDERTTAVLFAETTDFQPDEMPRLLNVLASFISENRFAADDRTTTAVASAIRKYAMNMNEEHFNAYASWLLPSQTDALGHELELELTKAVSWRLMYEPLTVRAENSSLLRVLSELCRSYLTPRLILQKNYAATVLHGLVAVSILEAVAGQKSHTDELIGSAINMQVEWFTEVLSDRLSESIEAVSEHSPALADRLRILTQTQLTGGEIMNHASEDSVR